MISDFLIRCYTWHETAENDNVAINLSPVKKSELEILPASKFPDIPFTTQHTSFLTYFQQIIMTELSRSLTNIQSKCTLSVLNEGDLIYGC